MCANFVGLQSFTSEQITTAGKEKKLRHDVMTHVYTFWQATLAAVGTIQYVALTLS